MCRRFDRTRVHGRRPTSCCRPTREQFPSRKAIALSMITDRDIAVRGVAAGHGPDTPVRELMTNDIVAARIEDETDDVAVRMSEAQVRRLPVIDDQQKLCGIVSLAVLTQRADS